MADENAVKLSKVQISILEQMDAGAEIVVNTEKRVANKHLSTDQGETLGDTVHGKTLTVFQDNGWVKRANRAGGPVERWKIAAKGSAVLAEVAAAA